MGSNPTTPSVLLNVVSEFSAAYSFEVIFECSSTLASLAVADSIFDILVFDGVVDGGSADEDTTSVDLVNVSTTFLIENIGLGIYADGMPLVVNVIIPFSQGGTSVSSDLMAALLRGIRALELLVLSADVMGALLAIFEAASNVMRPLSISIRLFANLTSGSLVSSLLTPAQAAPDLVFGVVYAGLVLTPLASSYCFSFVGFYAGAECFVGAIQTYVYTVLTQLYGSLLLD